VKRFAILLLALMVFAGASVAEGEGLDMGNNHRVFYEIFVGSFSDSDGDGTGDLRGIINRMDYLNDGDPDSGKSLGIEGIWLTPVFLSPSYHKYDVTDYYQIDPAFGTEEDLKELIALCHERDVKLILDLPLNHTGANNSWFRNFTNAHLMHSPDNIWYNFYTWLEPDAEIPSGRHFMRIYQPDLLVEANFSDNMPELNFDNERVRQTALDVAAYWLNLGIDGFRFDAAKYPYYGEHDRNAEFWTWYMSELKKINPDIYTVAEVWDGDGITSRYLDAFNCFRFATSQAEGLIADTARAGDVNKLVRDTQSYLDSIHERNPEAMNIPFIANHDTDRAAGYLTVASGRMQMAANLYLLTPGSPFIYYGEEIGLRGSRGGANTDANRRLAMLWGDGDTVKDPAGSTYDKQTPYSVSDLEGMAGSILKHYRKLIAIRKANPEIARGEYTALDFTDTKLGGFLCTLDGHTAGVFHNTTDKTLKVDLAEASSLVFSRVAASVAVDPFECVAELDGTVLTLGPQTSAVLK
jgi:glycosidase